MNNIKSTRFENLVSSQNWIQIKPRIFAQKYCDLTAQLETQFTIKELLEIWGYENWYDKMVMHLHNKITNNTDETLCIYFEYGSLNKEPTEQKLLGWDIYNNKTKKFIIVGGVLFQNGEMSFHT